MTCASRAGSSPRCETRWPWRPVARDIEAAHLLRLKPGSIPLVELHDRDDVPTLEDYRAQVDPDGVYGEAELIELY